MFLHGRVDTDVPVEQSIFIARELERHGVAHEVITIEGGSHSLWGGDRKLFHRAFKRSMDYIRERPTSRSVRCEPCLASSLAEECS